MKLRLGHRPEAALTLFEVGVVVAVVLILAAVLIPLSRSSRSDASRSNCVNNLKQIGLAYRIWEGDNGDIYPMGIALTNGGSLEMVATGNVTQTFQVMSNELSTPKILYCPRDTNGDYAATFEGLARSNVSYFVGVDVTNDASPMALISGDCNLLVRRRPVPSGLATIWTNDPVTWSAARHVRSGNLGLGDGSVQQATSANLQHYFESSGWATNRLAIP